MNRRLISLVLVAIAGLVAVPALAAPAREGTVSAAAPIFAWDGGPGNGIGQGVAAVRCTPAIYECEDTLIDLKDPGDLFAEAKGGDGANDIDIAIYASDASGTTDSPPGGPDNPLVEDISEGKDAKVTAKKLKPGFYVVRVRTFDGVQAVWKGKAELKLPPPPAPAVAPAPVATPTPAATPKPAKKTSKRKACEKKAKKIKNKRKRAKALKKCKKIKN